jgi:hypothetical protein
MPFAAARYTGKNWFRLRRSVLQPEGNGDRFTRPASFWASACRNTPATVGIAVELRMVLQFGGKGICGDIVACPSLPRPQDIDSFAGSTIC